MTAMSTINMTHAHGRDARMKIMIWFLGGFCKPMYLNGVEAWNSVLL